MEFKLSYGLRNDELLTIEEVEGGLSCDCVCPACKNQLIARKGNIKAHHFAHYKSIDCLSGQETALHIISKKLIEKSKTFKTPILFYPDTSFEIFDETEIIFDNVKLEKKIGEIIPDIIIESKGKQLLVEIVVNNPISWQKLQRIRSYNLPVIEVYAKHLFKRFYNLRSFGPQENQFEKELVYGTKYKRWLNNPKINSTKRNLKENYAEEKVVKYFKTDEIGYYNFVNECPLEKRVWKSGRNSGKPYASIDHDCNTCKFCVSIDYKHIPHNRLDIIWYSIPKKVYCLGYLKEDFQELLKEINK